MNPLLYAAESAYSKAVAPLRDLKYHLQTKPFVCRAKRGLLFELYPDEEIDRQIAMHGIYEYRTLRYLRHVIPQGAVMLDVGANIGNHALYLSDRCSQIHCFEPNPRAYNRLEKNIALNRVTNVKVHRFGLGDRDAVERFEDTGWLGMAKFSETGDQELLIRKGDDAVADIPRIDLIKIDVEGMEPSVLKGLSETIARHRPLVSFEYSGHSAGKCDWKTIRDALKGYRISEPKWGTLSNLARGGLPDFDEITTPENRWYVCLIASFVDADRLGSVG